MKQIPFMDLEAQIQSLEPEFTQIISQVIKEKSFIQGPHVEKFTSEFLKVHGGKFGVGCSNGTSAITVALRALNIGPGDEVLVPNHTFFGTLEPIVEVGAKPVLVEIDECYHQLNLKDAAKRLSPKTKAIMPVHLYGLPEPMDQIMEFARAHKLKVIEDCAQAHLAKWNGKSVGTFGDLATFSFYPGKNLGAIGDAGFIQTENEELFTFVKKYIDHGRQDKYLHEMFGGNFRMDGLQGAVLGLKLKKMEAWTESRRQLAKAYDVPLKERGFSVLTPRAEATPVYHLYVVEVANRDQVVKAFKSEDIGCGVHYPITMNAQPALAQFGYKQGQFEISEARAQRILSLPFFPEMTKEQMDRTLKVFFEVAEK